MCVLKYRVLHTNSHCGNHQQCYSKKSRRTRMQFGRLRQPCQNTDRKHFALLAQQLKHYLWSHHTTAFSSAKEARSGQICDVVSTSDSVFVCFVCGHLSALSSHAIQTKIKSPRHKDSESSKGVHRSVHNECRNREGEM